MTKAVEFLLRAEGGQWVLFRDGAELERYTHAERAIHEAALLAREQEESGQPATVHMQTADGERIEVETAEGSVPSPLGRV